MPVAANLDDVLAAARRRLPRVGAQEAALLVEMGALLVDTRPVEQRQRDGEVPGAVVIDRNVLEWRLDPRGAHRITEAGDPNRVVILMCNEGYASSLAAAALQDLGLHRAADLDGGFQA
ncbi:MAG: rhodanese-like domain-containing protein [Actinomycetota bacterium]